MQESGLLKRAKRFEPQALQALHERYFAPIYRYLRLKTADLPQAEDLTSEVFERVLIQLQRGHGWKTTPQAWIFGIARHTLADHYRGLARRGKDVALEVADYQISDPTALSSNWAERLDLLTALDQLPQAYQDVVILRFVERLRIQETAEAMNRTPDAVKALQRRALRKLAAILKRTEKSEPAE
jgi:RNA polymerase sigma-70 factor (ECF subfamily)